MAVDFRWNKSSAQIISDKGFGSELNRYFAEQLYYYSYPYTPYDPYRQSGAHMVDNVRIMANDARGQIVYQAKYAKKLWDGSYNFNPMVHPLACNHWTEVAWQHYKSEIISEVDMKRKELSV